MQETQLDRLVVSRPGLHLSYSKLHSCLSSIDFFSKMLEELSASNLKNMLLLIGRKLQFKEFAAEEVVYSKGDSNRDIYFVMDGEVGAFIIANNVLKEIRSFYSLQGFGDAEAITQTNRMFATIAKKQSLVAILKPNDFSDVLRDYNARVYQLRLGKFAANYILKGLNKSQLELVVHNAVEVRMSRNQVIYESGQPSEEMYLIEKGEVRLFNDVNRKQIEICELEDGELLGETEMILDHPRISSALCISDTLLLYKISKKLFLSQANEHLLNSLYQPLQEKETQRLQRFKNFCKRRIEIENPQIRFNRIAKLLEKGRILANKRYTELDDGNVYGSIKEGEVAHRIQRLISRKQKIMEDNYGISTRGKSQQQHVFFDLKKELRPKVLHSKTRPSRRHMKVNTESFSPPSEKTNKLHEISTIHRLSNRQHSYLFRQPKLEPTFRLPTLRTRHVSSKDTLT